MISLDLKTATEIIGGTLAGDSNPGAVFNGVSIDSRTACAGELFFAIRGANNDGHKFVPDAFARNVAGVVVESSRAAEFTEFTQVVAVADTTQALKELARKYRVDVGAAYVGITGSTGKTTVKEMIHHLLETAQKRSYASPGNFNNLFGLPLALLRMDRSVDFGVFELGISTPGEMDQLAPILEPTVAVITNISATHLEFLGSVDKVREEKLKLLSFLRAGGAAVAPADDRALMNAARDYGVSLVTFSGDIDADADVKPSSTAIDNSNGQPTFEYDGRKICLKLFGMHQVENAMCALASCRALKVDVDIESLATFRMDRAGWRGEIERVSDMTLVLDYYNAGPASMRAGLETFLALELPQGARKIAVLGDMLELGEATQREHEKIGEALARHEIGKKKKDSAMTALLTVGEHAVHISSAFDRERDSGERTLVTHCANSAEAGRALLKIVRPGDAVYFKASRGIKLEETVTILKGGAFKLN